MRLRRLAAHGTWLALLACAGGGTTFGPLPAGGHHVLFIGNSLTYVNDLPGTLATIAASTGDTIRTMTVAYPDFALEDHATQGDAPRAIAIGGWQYVVLQQGPSAVEANRQNLIQNTIAFDAKVRAVNGRTALYSVWPQSVNIADFPRSIDSYKMAADAVHGLFLPVGSAWQAAWARDPSLQLYAGDGLHPSPLATYLAAAVMYERITGKDARALTDVAVVGGVTVDVPPATVRVLQAAAHDANGQFPQP
jgi:hypothetical protein